MFTALFNIPVDTIFDGLKAPTADAVKLKNNINAPTAVNAIRRAGRRMSNVAKRIAVNAEDLASQLNKLGRQTKVGFSTREIPESAVQTYGLISMALSSLSSQATRLQQQREEGRRRILHELHEHRRRVLAAADAEEPSDEEHDDTTSTGDSGAQPHAAAARCPRHAVVVQSALSNRSNESSTSSLHSEVNTEGLFRQLNEELIEQRKLLKPREAEELDLQWGMNPLGEYMSVETLPTLLSAFAGSLGLSALWQSLEETLARTRESLGGRHLYTSVTADELIRKEMEAVKIESEKQIKKLEFATDMDIGMEVMYLFVLDILGRDTAAAKIFIAKAEEDYQHTSVVSFSYKAFLWCCVVCLNAFFVYFAMLRGFQRGLAWQQSYLNACIIQFLLEIFLMQTTEVVWVQFVVPTLVSEEVKEAADSLLGIIHTLCGDLAAAHAGRGGDSENILNLTKYLFVSRQVAAKYSNSLESQLVLSYSTYMPQELARKWSPAYNRRRLLNLARTGHAKHRGENDRPQNIYYSSNSVFEITATTTTIVAIIGTTIYSVVLFFLTFSIIEMLKALGSSPLHLQRIILHLAQPLFLAAIVYCVFVIWQNPVVSLPTLIGILLCLGAIQWIRKRQRPRVEVEENESAVPSLHQLARELHNADVKYDAAEECMDLQEAAPPSAVAEDPQPDTLSEVNLQLSSLALDRILEENLSSGSSSNVSLQFLSDEVREESPTSVCAASPPSEEEPIKLSWDDISSESSFPNYSVGNFFEI